MSHFAEIDSENKVIRVLVGANEDPGEGLDWILENLGGTWLKTSYNGKIRKNFAGIGYTYDPIRDAFIPPRENCHSEENFDEITCRWSCFNLAHNQRDVIG